MCACHQGERGVKAIEESAIYLTNCIPLSWSLFFSSLSSANSSLVVMQSPSFKQSVSNAFKDEPAVFVDCIIC